MIDHVTVRVQDFSRLLEFYKAALAPLRYEVVMQFEGVAGLGADGKPDLWLMQTDQPPTPTHVAVAGERDLIDAFHAAALEAGGSDNGGPGLRSDYHPHYYAAFVRDPEGNNIEVVCHADPEAKPAGAEVRVAQVRRARGRRQGQEVGQGGPEASSEAGGQEIQQATGEEARQENSSARRQKAGPPLSRSSTGAAVPPPAPGRNSWAARPTGSGTHRPSRTPSPRRS